MLLVKVIIIIVINILQSIGESKSPATMRFPEFNRPKFSPDSTREQNVPYGGWKYNNPPTHFVGHPNYIEQSQSYNPTSYVNPQEYNEPTLVQQQHRNTKFQSYQAVPYTHISGIRNSPSEYERPLYRDVSYSPYIQQPEAAVANNPSDPNMQFVDWVYADDVRDPIDYVGASDKDYQYADFGMSDDTNNEAVYIPDVDYRIAPTENMANIINKTDEVTYNQSKSIVVNTTEISTSTKNSLEEEHEPVRLIYPPVTKILARADNDSEIPIEIEVSTPYAITALDRLEKRVYVPLSYWSNIDEEVHQDGFDPVHKVLYQLKIFVQPPFTGGGMDLIRHPDTIGDRTGRIKEIKPIYKRLRYSR